MSGPQIHVLLVEDEESHAMLIQRAFSRAVAPETRLTWAATLAEARRCLAEDPPQMALVDAHLPDGRGLDLLPEITACPVVIMTSQEHSQTALEAKDRGAHDYVVKSPTVFRRLPELAQQLLGSSESPR